jgi:hypothetical protein
VHPTVLDTGVVEPGFTAGRLWQRSNRGELAMKNLVWYVAAFSAAAAFLFVKSLKTETPVQVDELAHKLEAAWADHHTVA